MIPQNKIRTPLFILSILSLLYIIGYCFVLWPWADDMVYRHELKNISIWDFTINEGKTVDTRWLSPLAFVRNIFFKYVAHQIGLVFYVLIFYTNTWILFFKIIKYQFIDKKDAFIFYSFFTLLVFYGLHVVVSEVIFWQAGAYYQLNLIVGLLAINEANKFDQDTDDKNVLSYLLFAFCGTLTYNLSLPILIYLIVVLIRNYDKFRKEKLKELTLNIILIFSVMCLMILMPSTFNRVSEQYNIITRLLIALRAFVHVPIEYFSYSYSIYSMIFFAFVYALYNPVKIIEDIDFSSFRKIIVYFTFLILSISTIFPFLIAPHLASKRTSLFFMVFLSIFVLVFTRDLISKVFGSFNSFKNIAFVSIFFFNIFHLYSFSDHYYMAYGVRKQYLVRDQYLKQAALAGEKKVYVPSYQFEMFVPYTLNSLKEFDLTSNPKIWNNGQYQYLYGIDSILIRNIK